MTIAANAIEGIHRAERSLDSTARTLASQAGITQLGGDEVTLSDIALALIQAKIGMRANVTTYHAAIEVEKALIDVLG